jgi:hypothetical protein
MNRACWCANRISATGSHSRRTAIQGQPRPNLETRAGKTTKAKRAKMVGLRGRVTASQVQVRSNPIMAKKKKKKNLLAFTFLDNGKKNK